MRIVSIGAAVRHTLLVIESEGARPEITHEYSYEGGAKLVRKLVSRIVPDGPHLQQSHSLTVRNKGIRTFARCSKYSDNLVKNTTRENNQVWRISKFVGQTAFIPGPEQDIANLTQKVKGQPVRVLIIEMPHVRDGKLPLIVSAGAAKKATDEWVVVKTETPDYISSKLYQDLHALYDERQVIIMSLDTLRSINKGPLIGSLSWESVAEAIQDGLKRELKDVGGKQPYAVIVSINNDGAACFCYDPARPNILLPKRTLIYDPESIEGEWAQLRPGSMAGYTQCIAAAVVAGAIDNFANGKDVEDYVIAGLHGGRKLHENGFNLDQKEIFPLSGVVKQIQDLVYGKESNTTFKTTPIPVKDQVNWSIVSQSFMPVGPGAPFEWKDIRDKLFKIVKSGMKEFSDVPVASFGKITAVLRDEVEGLRAIRGLIRDYSSRDSNVRPISIAVFGWPGSGKSFAVKAIAESISNTRREFKVLEFNLSQFSAPDQLYEALHQVRDLALSDMMPLVFWDEFDCDFHGKYGWLRYFLAPMQDKKFTQGPMTHSVSDGIFVFAGGTSRDMQSFRQSAGNEIDAKGPDFLSRLHGFLNIAGLDHDELDETRFAGVLIRRAILLHGLLKKYAPGIESLGKDLNIDDAVATAFLWISKFRYGARSMEAILLMSRLQGKTKFEPSCLPSVEQIHLHVDSSEWRQLLELGDAAPVLLNTIAW